MTTPTASTIQIGPAERRLIEQAAKMAGKHIEDFIHDSLLCAVDDVLLKRNLIITSPAKYAEFLMHLNRHAAPSERLQKTMQTVSPWDGK
jgi:uncharacterized protein (DUF1778 family)